MQKWEYSCVYVMSSLEQQEESFDKVGKQGWELACFGPRPPRATPDKPKTTEIKDVDGEEWRKMKSDNLESEDTRKEVFWFKRPVEEEAN